LRLLGLFEKVRDLGEGGDAGDQAGAQEAGDLVQHHELRGVGDGDGKAAFRLLQRHEVVAEHHVHGHGFEELVLDFEVLEVDKVGVVTTGKSFGALGLVEAHVVYGNGNCYRCRHNA
jgi:hypothetical protein